MNQEPLVRGLLAARRFGADGLASSPQRQVVAGLADRRRDEPHVHEPSKDPATDAETKDRLESGRDSDQHNQSRGKQAKS